MTRAVACIKARRYSDRYNTFWYVREVKPCEFEPWAHDLDDAVPYRHPGWLEYWIWFYKFERGDVANMVIGMIQRTKNAKFEFHC